MFPPISIDFFPANHEIVTIVMEYSYPQGIDPALVLAVIEQESAFDPQSERYEANVSGTGRPDYSAGLMQILTSTAGSMGFQLTGDLEVDKENLKDIRQNIYYGIKYLKSRLVAYKSLPLIDQVRTYNSGSPLMPSSSFYAANQAYGVNVMKYYDKWKSRLMLGTRSNMMENIVFSALLGGMCIYLDKKFLG